MLAGVLASSMAAFWTVDSAQAADRVYWGGYGANDPKISFANVNGTGGADLKSTGATIEEPLGLAIDAASGRVYWANDAAPKISFANLDGSGGGGDLNTTGATTNPLAGIAVHPAAGKIYWANVTPDTISFANLDGSGGGGDLNTGGATVDSAFGLTIDPAANRIYWPNRFAGTINFANLDGSGGGGQLNTTGATIDHPVGVAIDPVAGRIYWANEEVDKISFARLDGSGGNDLDTGGATVNRPYGVAIDPVAGRVYWANEDGNKISFAKLDGSGGGEDLITAGATVDGPAFPALLEAPSGVGAPVITGGSAPGSALACSQGSWASDLLGSFLYRAPQNFAYEWSREGATVAVAGGSSYTPPTVGDYRCKVSASNAAGSASQTSAPHAVLIADVSRFGISPRSFRAAGSGPSALPSKRMKQRKPGAKVSFVLNEAASVGFKVKQRLPGRQGRGGRCVKRRPGNRNKRKCIRAVTLRGGFIRAGIAGRNSFKFSGRLGGRKLRPGRYLLVATPTAGGRAGPARSTRFRIKKLQPEGRGF
jgi:hypothetical protein